MNIFTIKDIENLSGIQAHTIRIWEQRYSFLKPERTQTNIRNYNADELKTILKVALLNRFGFRISSISKMSGDEMSQKILEITQVQARYQHFINQLLEYMIDMKLDEFNVALSSMVKNLGVKNALAEVVFPFIERMGMLWAAGRINPAQEHFVSNNIRQKLLSATEFLPEPVHGHIKVMLFLPEGEMHELGILFIQYLIKEKGLQNWYLGANVPISDIMYIANAKQPDYFYTHFTVGAQNANTEKYILQLHNAFPKTPIIISGFAPSIGAKLLPDNVLYTQSAREAEIFIESIAA